MESLGVAIIEDQRDIREGLAALIGGTEGFRCTGGFRSVEEALGPLEAHPPDVVLLDVGLPGMSGIEGIPLIKQRCPRVAILMLTVYEDDDRIMETLGAGACGYLLKKTPPARLLDSLREVAAGGAPMSPAVARRVVELFRVHRPPPKVDYQLSPHETRLLGLLVQGHNYQTAAVELGVTVHAVSFHMRHIYQKLEVHSKSAAVAKALKQRLIG
jgi:DNA-binding NarL/FixJ family response regulator